MSVTLLLFKRGSSNKVSMHVCYIDKCHKKWPTGKPHSTLQTVRTLHLSRQRIKRQILRGNHYLYMVITDNSFMWLFYLLTYSQLDFKILFSCPLVSILFFRVVSVCHHYSEILEAASQVHKEKKLLIFYLGGWKFIERAQDLQGPHGSSQEAVHRKAHLKRQEERVGQLAPFKGNSLSIL